jgi:hypothetical protein
MQEINSAWTVLRNPASRAAYDDELRAASGREAEARAASRSATARSPAGVSFAEHLVDPTRPDPGGEARGHLRRWAPVLIVLGLLGLILVFTAYASHKPSDQPAVPGVELHTDAYQVGSCVVVVAGPEAASVSCDQPNSGRIASTTDYPRPCPPDTQTVTLVDRHLSLCLVPS